MGLSATIAESFISSGLEAAGVEGRGHVELVNILGQRAPLAISKARMRVWREASPVALLGFRGELWSAR